MSTPPAVFKSSGQTHFHFTFFHLPELCAKVDDRPFAEEIMDESISTVAALVHE
jgi:hypothetical protein